jgi:carboxymethylenebutenolidase
MCFDDDSRPPIPITDNSTAHGEGVELTAADGTRFAGFLAEPGERAGANMLILPDVRGLHEFYRELAMRFADIGTRALVLDYFGRTAPDDTRDNSFEYMPHVQQMTQQTFGADVDAAIEFLQQGEGRRLPTFVVGFCMGGSLALWTGTRSESLDGVIAFYASLTRTMGAVSPAVSWGQNIKAPVLAMFGGADQGIPEEDRAAFEKALEAGNVEHEIVVYDGAPHSFFDRKAAEFATASADAWSKVQGFIAGHSPMRV